MNKDRRFIIIFILLIILLVVLELVQIPFFSNELASEMMQASLGRLIGGSVFIVLLVSYGYKQSFVSVNKMKPILLVVIPSLLISINNFPIIAYFDNRAVITEPIYTIYIFVLECISVGFFEEIIFRGLLLVLLLQELPKTKLGVFQSMVISSLIFGFVHILNLFIGASFGPTLLQIGYSFLMGMLWSFVFIKTKNIWYGVFLHAIYNFGGLLFIRLGYVINQWDTVTVIVTSVLAVIVTIYMLLVFVKMNETEINNITE